MIKTPINPNAAVVLKAHTAARHTLRSGAAPRTDVQTRAVVDKALELQSIVGTSVAAGLLKQREVPFNVAERVLNHPELRRKA